MYENVYEFHESSVVNHVESLLFFFFSRVKKKKLLISYLEISYL